MMTEPHNTIKPDKKRQKMDDNEVSDLAIGLAIAAMRMPDINEPEFTRRNPEDYELIKEQLGLEPLSDSDIPPVEKHKKRNKKSKHSKHSKHSSDRSVNFNKNSPCDNLDKT